MVWKINFVTFYFMLCVVMKNNINYILTLICVFITSKFIILVFILF